MALSDPKSGPRRRSWLQRSVRAGVVRARRKGFSVRTQLIIPLGVLVFLAAISFGSIAYRTGSTIIQEGAMRDVEVRAAVRKQALLRVLQQQRDRANALLKTVDVGCLPDETWCLRKILVDFATTENATAARLVYRGYKPALAGQNAAVLAFVDPPEGGELMKFEFDKNGEPYYIIRVNSKDRKAVLTIRGDAGIANQIVIDNYGLKTSGETFLVDSAGLFLTKPKDPGPVGRSVPIPGTLMRSCLAGQEGAVLADDYRGVPAILGYRPVPEIGGGCIVASIDQAEAFAPARRIQREVAEATAGLAILAIVYSLILAQVISRPMKRLTERARSLQKGDFDSPVPVAGPAEVRLFARTFESMAHSLKSSRAALLQSQKLESVGVLAGGIAHDFNNLLTGIIGNASFALEELPPGSPARASMEAVVSGGERAALLTRQLLAYAGKGRFVIEVFDLAELIQEIGNLLRTSIPRTVQLRIDLPKSLPCIEGDVAQIQQLLMNLILNGSEAIGDGKTGTVWIGATVEEVGEGYVAENMIPETLPLGKYVGLEVRDNGCGMDQNTLARIFDPFFTTKFTGRGLGLAAAIGIVRGHLGALQVESAPGEGTTFKILLPVSTGQPAKRERTSTDVTLMGHGTVLVVDDEESVRQVAKISLEHYGYQVMLASDGKQGVEVFREHPEIIAVILDMTMPVLSGEQALVQMKQIRTDVPVVLSSGYNELDATTRFTGKGLAGFIQKPYTAARLAAQVRLVLGQLRAQAGR